MQQHGNSCLGMVYGVWSNLEALKAAAVVDFEKGERTSARFPPRLDPAPHPERPANLRFQ